MPDTPNQPDPKEAVEAQLCAYLEGDLSPAERAAIEQHLAGNPPHRQLLADLSLNRQWLRDLPKVSAPADVGEAFQQQVERSLLLGDDVQFKPQPGGGRLTQFAMMAALIAITAGLGVGLMLMLSGPDRPSGRVAANFPTSRPIVATGDKQTPTLDVPATQPAPPLATAAMPATPLADAARPPEAATRSRGGGRTDGFGGGGGGGGVGFNAMVRGAPDALAAQGPSRSLYLRVAAADPAAVDRVLTTHGLALEGVPGAAIASRDRRGGVPGTQDVAEQQDAGQDAQQIQQRRMVQNKMATNSASGDASLLLGPQRYVARGLTAEQAGRLTADLQAAVGPAQVTTIGPRPIVGPDAAKIAAGEVVTVVIPQLTGPGVAQTNTVHVASDGTIALPMIDPVPAAGATKDALAHRVADRYRQANLIANPTVTVVTTVTPTTQPAAGLEMVTVEVDSPAAAGKR